MQEQRQCAMPEPESAVRRLVLAELRDRPLTAMAWCGLPASTLWHPSTPFGAHQNRAAGDEGEGVGDEFGGR
jgi:hypothetical protein